MSCDVYANCNEIACKAGSCKVIAAFPDVCLSPPSPPAGPIPIPYPDTSFSKDMMNGSKTVKIKGQEVMLKDQSFYKTAPLGDEAATQGLGAGVITHVITGKTYFNMWSMDVKFEGQNVDRHLDITTSNHMSPPPNEGVPMPTLGMMTAPAFPDLPPPGDCTPEEHAALSKEVDDAKAEVAAAGGKCKDTDSPETLRKKSKAWLKQAVARSRRETRCYRGGNEGHQEAMASAWDHVGRCQKMLKSK
jgi:hypothetical protein